jgi:hypothetical protein
MMIDLVGKEFNIPIRKKLTRTVECNRSESSNKTENKRMTDFCDPYVNLVAEGVNGIFKTEIYT